MRTAFVLAFFLACGSAAAQTGAGENRGSAPPGTSQDGARPAEGAITGGSLAPGESGGTPRKDPAAGAAAGGTSREVQRCYQLEGTLREQCLADRGVSRNSSAGRAPSAGSAAAPARRPE